MNDILDELVRKNSKYSLVVAVAKRARELTDGAPKLMETRAHKSVTIAMDELAAEKLDVIYPESDGAR
ncbi:MAG: DNA-directed RNA polymerase subunit omega [Symbiobacteriia bacterium]